MNYTLLGAFLVIFFTDFFSTRSGHTARQTAAPSILKHEFLYKEVPFGGLVDTLPFWGILGSKPPIWGPKIGNRE